MGPRPSPLSVHTGWQDLEGGGCMHINTPSFALTWGSYMKVRVDAVGAAGL